MQVRTTAIDDPGDLLSYLADPAGVAWVRRGEGLVGWGEAARFAADGPGRFGAAREAFSAWASAVEVADDVQLPGTGPVAFCAFTFDPESAGSVAVVPRVVLGRRGGHAWMTVIDEGDAVPAAAPPVLALQALPAPGRIRYAGSALNEVGWLESVARAVKSIAAGDLEKVVLARDVTVWSESPLDARVLARRLADRFADCFTFVCDGLVGATPELLVRRHADVVESLVLAGSAPRGETAAEDDDLARQLLHSHKDTWEHQLAVDSVRPVLSARCGALRVEGPNLLRLANVHHLATSLSGALRTREHVLSLVEALHPTAAVCGTPTAEALHSIRALEGMDRARYAGPVGWTDSRGDGEFGIALRCAEVQGSRARLFAGAGIVAESLPEAELEETRIKLRAMQSALEQA